jgi:hypothetical protein
LEIFADRRKRRFVGPGNDDYPRAGALQLADRPERVGTETVTLFVAGLEQRGAIGRRTLGCRDLDALLLDQMPYHAASAIAETPRSFLAT